MTQNTSKKLTIFEGPDGSGKSTTARRYAEQTGAKYVHFPALPRVNRNLARMYVEAMLPAVLGYQDVVFDRSWLSEMPYGLAFREGFDRMAYASRRMLERLALRCGVVVVMCDPGWKVVRENFMARKHLEMLDNDTQLKTVYDLYAKQRTDLPVVTYNYRGEHGEHLPELLMEAERTIKHPLDLATAGNWQAEYVLIGEAFAERKDLDAWYQWPFASFSPEGCSQWLTSQLPVGEDKLLWVNADQDLSFLYELSSKKVIALGSAAYSQLYKLKIAATQVPHPQHHKRFDTSKQYQLIELLGG